jgi:hypothetical protein
LHKIRAKTVLDLFSGMQFFPLKAAPTVQKKRRAAPFCPEKD